MLAPGAAQAAPTDRRISHAASASPGQQRFVVSVGREVASDGRGGALNGVDVEMGLLVCTDWALFAGGASGRDVRSVYGASLEVAACSTVIRGRPAATAVEGVGGDAPLVLETSSATVTARPTASAPRNAPQRMSPRPGSLGVCQSLG